MEGHYGFMDRLRRSEALLSTFGRIVVMILSIALIVFISYDTFKGINFLESRVYMDFQFWVCIVFLTDFFLQLAVAPDKKRYLKGRWFFFVISVPYLNLIGASGIDFSPEALYFIRFIPLVRGAYAFTFVVGFVSTNRAFSLLTQYAVIFVSILYFSSLIFYYEEKDVNSNVLTYWDALYWACMDCTTVGSYISAVTVIGKILVAVLPLLGMMVIPLFTVFITTKVKEYNKRISNREENLEAELRRDFPEKQDSGKPPTTPDSKTQL